MADGNSQQKHLPVGWMMENKPISEPWERGDSYDKYIGRWSRQIAPKFLAWLACPTGLRWLDVGCGTGALCAAIADHCSPKQISGVEPSEGFRKVAKENLSGRAVIYPGTAASLPLEPASVDVVVSGLVLNFVADPRAALVEMARVAHPGGVIAAYVWDYAGKMELIHHFWKAAAELDPDAAREDQGTRFPLCNPQALSALFTSAGLRGVETAAVDIPTHFTSFADYWQPFLGGQGPGPAYVMALAEPARTRLRDHLQKRLPTRPDGSIHLVARAWAVRANVE